MKNKGHIFDMISRTQGDSLPAFDLCIESKTINFIGSWSEITALPLRFDMQINENILVGDVKQKVIHKNGSGYVAEYSVYAIHEFEDKIPV